MEQYAQGQGLRLIWASRTAYCVQSRATAGRRLGRIDAAAALESKAALGLAITDKPLVDNAIIRTRAGVVLGLGF